MLHRLAQTSVGKGLTAFNRQIGLRPLRAMSRLTGFSLEQFWRLERVLDLRDQRNEIQHIVATSNIPVARQILIKLFLSRDGLAGQIHKNRGGVPQVFTTKYDMVTDASEAGRVQIKARLQVEYRRRWFFMRATPRARVKISCRLLNKQNFCEFHQEFFLMGKKGLKVRQRQGRFISRKPLALLAEPQALQFGVSTH